MPCLRSWGRSPGWHWWLSPRDRLSRQHACSLVWCAPLCNTARSSVEVSPCFRINSSYTTPITMSRTNLYLHKLNEHHCCVTLRTKYFRRKCAFTKPTLPSKTDCQLTGSKALKVQLGGNTPGPLQAHTARADDRTGRGLTFSQTWVTTWPLHVYL